MKGERRARGQKLNIYLMSVYLARAESSYILTSFSFRACRFPSRVFKQNNPGSRVSLFARDSAPYSSNNNNIYIIRDLCMELYGSTPLPPREIDPNAKLAQLNITRGARGGPFQGDIYE